MFDVSLSPILTPLPITCALFLLFTGLKLGGLTCFYQLVLSPIGVGRHWKQPVIVALIEPFVLSSSLPVPTMLSPKHVQCRAPLWGSQAPLSKTMEHSVGLHVSTVIPGTPIFSDTHSQTWNLGSSHRCSLLSPQGGRQTEQNSDVGNFFSWPQRGFQVACKGVDVATVQVSCSVVFDFLWPWFAAR